MQLVVNGEMRFGEPGDTLARLLCRFGIEPAKVAIERNGVIVSRSAYERTLLEEGDRLEIVEFVGGG